MNKALSPEILFEPISISSNRCEEVSNTLLNNKTYLANNFKKFSYKDKRIWSNLSSTYNLYLHCLYDVHYLNILYDNTLDKKYLKKAKKLLKDWLRYNKSKGSHKNKFIWSDHAVSKRTLSILHFLLRGNKKNKEIYDEVFLDQIEKILLKQGNWLSKKENYSRGNHGLMMDTALLALGVYKQKNSWIKLSMKRINDRAKKDFSNSGIHLENSPDYHVLVMNHYLKIKDFLDTLDLQDRLDHDTYDIISELPNYLTHIIMPNKHLPRIGDSENTLISNNYHNNNLKYILSDGTSGEKPSTKTFYDRDAGIFTYRSSWKKEDLKDSLWWTIKSGAKNSVHKQKDDLSFMIYAFGNEIFSDAGKYNYDSKDIFRQYAVSPQGHNTISVKDQNYYISENLNMIEHLRLLEKTSKYIWLSARNNAYKQTLISRDFIFLKPNTFIIIDCTKAKNKNLYSQHFLLGPNMKIIDYNTNSFHAVSNDKKVGVQLNQHIGIQKINLFRANQNTGKGYVFERFENKTPVDYIEFLKEGNNVTYITSIQLNNSHYKNKIKQVKLEKNTLKLLINNETFVFNLEKLKL
jgi:hypothetical protein